MQREDLLDCLGWMDHLWGEPMYSWSADEGEDEVADSRPETPSSARTPAEDPDEEISF